MPHRDSPLEDMIREQLVRRGIKDSRVLKAMADIDRKCFVMDQWQRDAYRDGPLPLICDQTISQPYIVALMSELLEPGPSENCLEIGTGSGYQTAILCRLCRHVTSIERVPELHRMAISNLSRFKLSNLDLRLGDGREGAPEQAPFHRIIVTAAPESLPAQLTGQLADGGVMVIPVGPRSGQVLYRIRRSGKRLIEEPVCGVLFVPLT